jgi:hypothetical protein
MSQAKASGCANIFFILIGLSVVYYGGMLLIAVLFYTYEAVTSPFVSIEGRKAKCIEAKDREMSRSIFGCAALEASIDYDLKGEAACIKYFSRATGFKAKPAQKYSIGANTINQIWTYSGNNKPIPSLIECRRDSSNRGSLATVPNNSNLLQWRKISYEGDKLIHETPWSVGRARIFYSHSEFDCIGKSIPQCDKTITLKENSATPRMIPDSPSRERPPVLSQERDLEKRAHDEIDRFDNWSGNGPAPQPIRAMEDAWRCNKYGDC